MSATAILDLATATASDFLPHVDSEFTLPAGTHGGRVPLTLLEVTAYAQHCAEASGARREPFGLVFRCEAGVLGQGIYRLEHAEFPACEIFLSPFDGGDGWCKLEAIFN